MNSRWTGYQSILAEEIKRFVECKRALGRKYFNEDRALRLLDRFLAAEQSVCGIKGVTGEMLERFLRSRPRKRPRSFNHLLGVVRGFFGWLVTQGSLVASPLRIRPRRETAKRIPFLFDSSQARRLLELAGNLPDRPRGLLRGSTYRTLFALLYGLGLRVSEACHLLYGDLDLERAVLTVRGGKFGKTRLVPFGPRMSGALREHIERRFGMSTSPELRAPVFSFDRQRCVNPASVSQTFHHLVPQMDFVIGDGCSPPRLHDLRHSFAVGTLLRWYRQGVDPSTKLIHLSTFLGHVDPVSTAVYLTITEDLFREANRRFEAFAAPTLREAVP